MLSVKTFGWRDPTGSQAEWFQAEETLNRLLASSGNNGEGWPLCRYLVQETTVRAGP